MSEIAVHTGFKVGGNVESEAHFPGQYIWDYANQRSTHRAILDACNKRMILFA